MWISNPEKEDTMKVSDVMSPDPVCCIPENSIVEVAKMMKDCDCGAIPVVKDQAGRKAAGIVTDRDLVVRAIAEAKDPLLTQVEACMTRSTVTVHPEDDLDECATLMKKHQIRRILVVDGQGAVTGIVTQAQIARNMDEEETGEVVQGISEP
jgi:CBS domain-containing protein